jgi:hypothetical protein
LEGHPGKGALFFSHGAIGKDFPCFNDKLSSLFSSSKSCGRQLQFVFSFLRSGAAAVDFDISLSLQT